MEEITGVARDRSNDESIILAESLILETPTIITRI